MRLGVGSTLSLDTAGEALVLKPVRSKPKYTLEELMAQCELDAPEPAGMADWNAMRPVGREAARKPKA